MQETTTTRYGCGYCGQRFDAAPAPGTSPTCPSCGSRSNASPEPPPPETVPRATADMLRAGLDRVQLDRVRGIRRRIAGELDEGRDLVGERIAREIENLLDELDDTIREGEESIEAERLHRQRRDKRALADERSTAHLVGVGDGGLVFELVEDWQALAVPVETRPPAVRPREGEAEPFKWADVGGWYPTDEARRRVGGLVEEGGPRA